MVKIFELSFRCATVSNCYAKVVGRVLSSRNNRIASERTRSVELRRSRRRDCVYRVCRSLHLLSRDSRRSGIWHSRPDTVIWSRPAYFASFVDLGRRPITCRKLSIPGNPPMDCRIWEATTRFVRYGAAALAAIRTSCQLANSNLRCPLIEKRYTSPEQLHQRTNEEISEFDSVPRYHSHNYIMR